MWIGFLEFIFELVAKYGFPIVAHEYALRREADPVFKSESDAAYAAVKSSTTTADRDAASRKLYELQKDSKSS